MSDKSKRWVAYNKDYSILNDMVHELGVSDLISRVLINRDIDSVEKGREFINANLEGMHNPYLMSDMDKAVNRVIDALEEQQKICIFGDYDVDGVTSTCILLKLLNKLESDVIFYLPNRIEEGYGLNKSAIDYLKNQDVDLIITVDCGIRAIDIVDYVNKNNIDIIITDHHECGDIIPNAYAVLNPHRIDCQYPFKELAGVGVAFKLAEAIATELGHRDFIFSQLEIVALGTIADIVDLKGENRIIVKQGLEQLEKTENLGLKALMNICGLAEKSISTYSVAFMISPRINAAGRMANASLCVELLLTDDVNRANEISLVLDNNNKERKETEARILKGAIEKIEESFDFSSQRIIVLNDENWHTGVIGIVASKLIDKYNLPVILIANDDKIGKGSARSVDSFNIYEAIEKCSDLLVAFGGHELAAGITINIDDLDLFRKKINEVALHMLQGEALVPQLLVDYKLTSKEVNMSTVKEFDILKPFGAGNPTPLFVFRGLKVLKNKTVGANNNHLLLTLHDGEKEVRGIGFNMGSTNSMLSFGKNIDIICSIDYNLWNNVEQLQLIIKDIKPSK